MSELREKWWGDVHDDPSRLRARAEHYRKLAKIIVDQKVAAQLLATAERLEATAKQMDDELRLTFS